MSQDHILRHIFFRGDNLTEYDANIKRCTPPTPQASQTFSQVLNLLERLPVQVLLEAYPDPYGPRSILGTNFVHPISGKIHEAGGVIGFVMVEGGSIDEPYCWLLQGVGEMASSVVVIDRDEAHYLLDSEKLDATAEIAFKLVFEEAFDVKKVTGK